MKNNMEKNSKQLIKNRFFHIFLPYFYLFKTSAPSAVDAASRVHLRRLAALHREAMQGIQEAERALRARSTSYI